MQVYITKYALTHGIIKTEATRDPKDPTIVRIARGKGTRILRGNDWFARLRDAQARAAEMRDNRVISLDRQRDRICSMKF